MTGPEETCTFELDVRAAVPHDFEYSGEGHPSGGMDCRLASMGQQPSPPLWARLLVFASSRGVRSASRASRPALEVVAPVDWAVGYLESTACLPSRTGASRTLQIRGTT